MSENGQTADISEKIEKIYRIIEFEIENANNQQTLFKKDTLNFILLILALIGFFAFIPIDVFAYNWFGNGILMMLICAGCALGLSLLLIREFDKQNKNQADKNSEKKCESCDSSTVCELIEDPQAKEKIRKKRDALLIENIGLVLSAFKYTGFCFLITALASYFYLITYEPSRQISSLIQSDPIVVIVLLLTVVVYFLFQRKNKNFPNDGFFRDYLLQQVQFSAFILVPGIFLECYGCWAKIPALIPISATSQFSTRLIEHSNSITPFQIDLILFLYTLVIFIVLFEYFFSSKYVEKINSRLVELFHLKYRIDRFQLGITPSINIEQIQRELMGLKIRPPKFLPFTEIIHIPIPLDFDTCEDIIYLAVEESPAKEEKDLPEGSR